ncbi:uncharacterized protein MELLADRAFT_60941 [Melampsora larici-populina 98AG31]|uniref:Uncharacterized protein n=1 Tax=Melampsora larici-populina (strain 98AG31 / pathotype 3-4-7) TaxID=747676 RepID=F4RD09_MELLP|nr:uncharacterized protein MELLADRAFT_60941 [Melampsora larici-populina 98AG31]EGG09817.1 hypothetical protein MELLADRAFT_60941 [Melampsora larici-populina 98AG31]
MVPAPKDKVNKDAESLPLRIRATNNQTEKTDSEVPKATASNNQSISHHQEKSSPPMKPGTLTNSSSHKESGHTPFTSHNITSNITSAPLTHVSYSNASSNTSKPISQGNSSSTSPNTIDLNEYGPEVETNASLPSGVPRPSVLCAIVFAALAGCAVLIWIGSRILLAFRRKRSKANRKEWTPPKPNQRGPKEENELEIIQNERDSIGKDLKFLSSSSFNQNRFQQFSEIRHYPQTPEQHRAEEDFTKWWREKQWNEDDSTLNHKRPESSLSKFYDPYQSERNESRMGFRKLSVCSSSGGSHSSHNDKRIGNYDHNFSHHMIEPKKKVKVDGWLGTVGEEAGCRSSMGSTWSQESWEDFEAHSSISPSDSASRVPYPQHSQHHQREPSSRRNRLVSIQELPPLR